MNDHSQAHGYDATTAPRLTVTGIELQLTGGDGNAFAVLGAARKAMRKAGTPQDIVDQFMADATTGDYDHLLATVCEWFEVA